MKLCPKCKKIKNFNQFSKGTTKDGYYYCCKFCQKKHQAQYKEEVKIKCIDCGIEKYHKSIRCRKCYLLNKKKNNSKMNFCCIDCKKEKSPNLNLRCRRCSKLGHSASEDTRKLWSKQRKGRKLSALTKEKIVKKTKGKKRSLAQRAKMSNKKTGLSRTPEEYCQHLQQQKKEGRREKEGKSYQSKDWAKKIKIRDNYTCQKCFKKVKNICAHHIKSWSKYPQERFSLKNGITLCFKCHVEVHSKQLEGFIIK